VPQPKFINQNLEADYNTKLMKLLKEYVDCSALNWTEMPGLWRELVEHHPLVKHWLSQEKLSE
jgi:hypothetical protein